MVVVNPKKFKASADAVSTPISGGGSSRRRGRIRKYKGRRNMRRRQDRGRRRRRRKGIKRGARRRRSKTRRKSNAPS